MNIRRVMDDVLTGYAKSGGTFEMPKRKYHKHVFTHIIESPCVKRPPGSQKDSYYALHHLRAFVRNQHDLTLPYHLKKWATCLAAI
jgi:hypothetical protein